MAIVKVKPTSPGRRFVIKIKRDELHKGSGFPSLVVKKKNDAGRNNQGRITSWHKGSGHKQLYRIIDFKRNKFDVEGTVVQLEYDPNRNSHIALVLYKDGERRYIIAQKGLKKGSQVVSSMSSLPVEIGNAMPLEFIPLGTEISCIELIPNKGAQIARSAGVSATLLAKDGKYCLIRLKSGEVRKVLVNCMAVIGGIGNSEHNLRSYGKAGAKRWLGIRPHVRGVAMNPVDHPLGGGEGKTSGGRHPVTPWGKPTKGYLTRSNKRTDGYIVKKRSKK